MIPVEQQEVVVVHWLYNNNRISWYELVLKIARAYYSARSALLGNTLLEIWYSVESRSNKPYFIFLVFCKMHGIYSQGSWRVGATSLSTLTMSVTFCVIEKHIIRDPYQISQSPILCLMI